MSPILYAFIFVAGVLVIESLYFLTRNRAGTRQTGRRLERLARALQDPVSRKHETALRDPDASRLNTWLAAIPGRNELALELYRAGLPMTSQRFLLVSCGMAFAGLMIGIALFPGSLPALLPMLAGLLPWLRVRGLVTEKGSSSTAATKRLATFEQQLPDALDLLVRSLRAGHSLTSGLKMVGEELSDPIGTEFAHVANEIALGKETKQALDNLLYRVPSVDLPFFVTAISIQQETGSNLAEVLENLSGVIRERFKVLGKVRALTAMGRMSANILAVWPVIMLGAIYSVNPDYIAPLWENPAGHTMVMIAIALIIVGYVLCRRMAQIKV